MNSASRDKTALTVRPVVVAGHRLRPTSLALRRRTGRGHLHEHNAVLARPLLPPFERARQRPHQVAAYFPASPLALVPGCLPKEGNEPDVKPRAAHHDHERATSGREGLNHQPRGAAARSPRRSRRLDFAEGRVSKIEWTDQTWNPVTGCTKVSPGCAHCYAEGVAHRFWKGRAFTDVRMHPDRLGAPLRWRKPRRVFVNSMSDLFHEDVPDEFIDRVFGAMALCPAMVFQVLTKRTERMRDYMAGDPRDRALNAAQEQVYGLSRGLSRRVVARFTETPAWPLNNVWLGVSVEDQARADERIPLLLETPAAVRFLSCEPLLGPVDLNNVREDDTPFGKRPIGWGMVLYDDAEAASIDWVIVGGESGPNARPCDVTWIREIRDQCKAADVPVFVKQLGARPMSPCDSFGQSQREVTRPCGGSGWLHSPKDRKGGDWSEWPHDLRVRQYPEVAA